MTLHFIHNGSKIDLPTGTIIAHNGGLFKVIPRKDVSYLSYHPCTYCQADDDLCAILRCDREERHDDVDVIVRLTIMKGGDE